MKNVEDFQSELLIDYRKLFYDVTFFYIEDTNGYYRAPISKSN